MNNDENREEIKKTLFALIMVIFMFLVFVPGLIFLINLEMRWLGWL